MVNLKDVRVDFPVDTAYNCLCDVANCGMDSVLSALGEIEEARKWAYPTPVNYCNPVNGVHAPFCTGHESEKE
jgi:hypothetical protein